MPNLPTISVTQNQADRIIAAFGAGGTQAEAVARYKEWLRIQVNQYTQETELLQMRRQHQQEEMEKMQEIQGSLPQPDPVVP